MVLMDSGRPTLASKNGDLARFTDVLELGYRLAETSCGIAENQRGGLWAAKGWKELVAHMPAERQPLAALALENCRRYYGDMNEATRTTSLGSADRWIFPLVSNMAENDIIDQLVSVQPMPGPQSQLVYMDVVTSQRKGNIPAGSPMWRALAGAADRFTDSDELVTDEPLGTTNGSGVGSGNAEYFPIRAGSVQVVIGAGVATDDGNGVLAGDFSGTVNYQNGAITVASAANSTAMVLSYSYDSEGSNRTMGMELAFTSAPVKAKAYKLRTAWSQEADQNMAALYNIKAENIMLNAITGALQYQKHRRVIAELRNRANAGAVTWSATAPANVSYQTHKLSILDAFATGSNYIYGATNTMEATWAVLGLQAKAVVETLPSFQSRGNQDRSGVAYIGDVGNLKVFADPHYQQDEYLLGYKGDAFFKTVFILGEWQKLYTTPTYQLDDFMNRRGFATSYATKMVNSKGLSRGIVTNAPTSYGA